MTTHEAFIAAVAEIAIGRLTDPDEIRAARAIKLVYGAGPDGTRGVTYFNRWAAKGDDAAVPFVELAAFGQSSLCQLAGTTIHELGHVVAGWAAGHGEAWKAACGRLGLRRILAAGTDYQWAHFAPDIRARIAALPQPAEGTPVARLTGIAGRPTPKPCGAGYGTRGGRSRGPGSGSRLKLWHCACLPPVKVRAAGRLHAHCDICGGAFKLADGGRA